MQRKQILVLVLVVAGVFLGVMAAQWKICETSKSSPDETVYSSDRSVQVVMYTTSCRRWWAREADQETLSYVMLPGPEQPPAKPDEADIIYQLNWITAAGRSGWLGPARLDLGTEDEVRGAILLSCEKNWCPKQEAILKQVKQWRGHRIFYERK